MARRPLGRLPKHDPETHPRLYLSNHLYDEYKGSVPNVVDYSGTVSQWPMYLNDQISDCTAADAGHGLELWTQYGAGTATVVTDNDILAFYEGSTGYNPNDPSTDQGGNMQDVNNYYLKNGLAGHRIIAFFEVNSADDDELRAALYLFGGVSIGMDFPAFAMDQFEAGKPWDTQWTNSGIDGGHDVLLVGMTKGANYKVITWGKVQEVTPKFWKKYMAGRDGEAWSRVSQEWVNSTGAIPAGLDAADANAAFQQITGKPGPFIASSNVPAPAPKPMPVVGPDQDLATAMHKWLTQKGL